MKKIIKTIYLTIFFTPISFAYTDINSINSYYDATEWGELKGYINGYSDGSFRPYNKINRAEFIKIIVSSSFENKDIFNCNTSSILFPDYDSSAWYSPYVCLAYQKGIIKGYDDGFLRPEKEISIAEAAKIISISKIFTFEKITTNESWYNPYLVALNNGQIPTTFTSPHQDITRGEMIEVLYRIENKIVNKESKFYDVYDEKFKTYKYLVVGIPPQSTIEGYHYFNSHYAINPRDKKMLYFGNDWEGKQEMLVVHDIDYQSFQIVDEFTAGDKNNIYYKGRVVGN